MSSAPTHGAVGAARHLCAIALLPFMNAVAIPSMLLALYPPMSPHDDGVIGLTALIAGSALAVAGTVLVVHSITLFVRHGHGTLAPWDPTRELVSSGAYRYVRNPMKTGLLFVLAGEALSARSLALAAWFAAFALANVVYIRLHEEPRLQRRFGERYREYCARVPRWCPPLRTSKDKAITQ